MSPLFQDSPDPKPQLQAWGCGLALEELSSREAGPERAAVGPWAVVNHLDLGAGVGKRSALDSGPCIPEKKHRAAACSVWLWKVYRLWVLAGLGIGEGCQEEHRFDGGFHVFLHCWLPGSYNGTQHGAGSP